MFGVAGQNTTATWRVIIGRKVRTSLFGVAQQNTTTIWHVITSGSRFISSIYKTSINHKDKDIPADKRRSICGMKSDDPYLTVSRD
jgi:hypothetical protein